jgi:hypothetical protein
LKSNILAIRFTACSNNPRPEKNSHCNRIPSLHFAKMRANVRYDEALAPLTNVTSAQIRQLMIERTRK